MKKNYIIILILFAMNYLFSASPVVSSVVVTPGSGQILITYDLYADAECQIIVLVSADDGDTYDIYPTDLTGHVGDSVVSGSNQIIWRPAGDGMEIGVTYKVKIIARDNPITEDDPDYEEHFESFLKIEGATFNNGRANVTISDFYMSKYEVSQAEYEAVMGENESSFTGPNRPVDTVSWFHAVKYCNLRSLQEGLTPCYNYNNEGLNPTTWSTAWDELANHESYICDFEANGYRLPTEMEWIFAAKGGNETPSTGYNKFAGTDLDSDLTSYAWYSLNSGGETHDVGTVLSNQLGLYDMSGNVNELLWDIWSNTYSSEDLIDPTGPSEGNQRTTIGGDYGSDSEFQEIMSSRWYIGGNEVFDFIGFRLARSGENTPIPMVVTDPVIFPEGGSFNEAQTITINCVTEDASIYFTVDGTDPTDSATLYEAPIELSETTTVKAKAYKDGWESSDTVSELFDIEIADVAVEIEGFVLVEGGRFNRDNSTYRFNYITISDFYLGEYEVTLAQYIEFLNSYSVSSDGSYNSVELIDMDSYYCAIDYIDGSFVMGSGPYTTSSECPVIEVSWYGSAVFCNWLSEQEDLTPCYDTSDWTCDFTANGYRLPTEMEWMYAAKGGNQEAENSYNLYAGTNVISDFIDYAWYRSNANSLTHEVGRKLANQLGLYDMSGNVAEWCNDWYDDYTGGPLTNPVGPTSGTRRVFRGGTWYDSAGPCSVTRRNSYPPLASSGRNGFRVSRSLN